MNKKWFCWFACIAFFVVAQPTLFAQGNYLPSIPQGTITIGLTPIATGLGAPLYGISPPGDTSRLFVLDQKGLIDVIQNGTVLPTPALDMQSRIQIAPVGNGPLNPANGNDERGLLGLAFYPGFNDLNSVGYHTLYTYESEALSSPTYPAPNNATQNYMNVVTEWKMSASNPNVIDPSTRRTIISFGKNASNHNGGTVTFGPDGYLYLALGDGGNANDVGASHIEPGGNAQNLTTPLGKMIRIDPINPALTSGSPNPISSNGQYRLPADNPVIGPGQTVPELYAMGLRNPYRFAFDSMPGGTGDLIEGDVGQNNIEEINRIVKGGNYGWAVKEGTFLFNRADGTIGAPPGNNSPGSPAGLIDPISNGTKYLEYDHQDGISITGGFVYRGSAIPELYGKYVFGDLAITGSPARINGRIFYADLATAEIKEFLSPQFVDGTLSDGSHVPVMPNNLTVHGFGQDANGELYAMVTNTAPNGTGGIVYKLTAVPEPASILLALIGVASYAAWGRKPRITK
jgi:Glucose / Sorbosone dehydrogenase